MIGPEIIAALDAMLEQGNQLRASELIPVLKEIINSILGGGGIEPYFVQNGITNNTSFVSGGNSAYVITVTADEYSNAKAAFLAGRPVLILGIDSLSYLVVGHSMDVVADAKSEFPVEGLVLYNRTIGEVSFDSAIALVVAV